MWFLLCVTTRGPYVLKIRGVAKYSNRKEEEKFLFVSSQSSKRILKKAKQSKATRPDALRPLRGRRCERVSLALACLFRQVLWKIQAMLTSILPDKNPLQDLFVWGQWIYNSLNSDLRRFIFKETWKYRLGNILHVLERWDFLAV